MSEPKWTPGKWHMVTGRDGRPVGGAVYGQARRIFCDIDTTDEDTFLIVEAPDLARNLATAVELVRLRYGNLDPYISEFLMRADATLARAHGEVP